MRRKSTCLLLFCAGLLWACALACEKNEITILSYNVQNMFDGVADGSEYPEFDPSAGNWNDALYQKKLMQIAAAIRGALPGGPDILLVQEIENRRVLEELAAKALADCGYRYLVAPAKTASATTVGVASRIPVVCASAFMLPPCAFGPQREIIEVMLAVDGERWIILNSHWKSKSEGAQATEEARLESAALVAERIRGLKTRFPGATVLVAGDLNERHDEYLRAGKAYQTALIMVGEETETVLAEASLFLCDAPDGATIHKNRAVLFEPWILAQSAPEGSYFYAKQWEGIDHILYLPGETAWQYAGFSPCAPAFLLDPAGGAPLSWSAEHPQRGFSDHLPVVFRLTRK